MLDPKIDSSQSSSDSTRVRLDVGAVDAAGRQRRDPNTRRDFKKVLQGEVDEGEISEAELQAAKVRAPKMRRNSIFDVGTPQSLETKGDVSESTSTKSSKSSRKQRAGSYASGDISSLDASRQTQSAQQRLSFDIEAGTSSGTETSTSTNLQQIIDQIVDSIYTLKADNKTETVLTLKHPPELVGSELVLTAFSQARGEFNIAIHNLTQAAQLFLEQNNIRLGLKQALEERGYTVHIITTTTQPFKAVAMEGPESTRRDQQQRDEDSQQQERKNR